MAFEIQDFNMHYVRRGEVRGLFNVARSDETLEALRYYLYQNENGAYIIQQITTSGSLTVKVYKYYGKKTNADLDANWSNRSSLTYGEYMDLFPT